MVKSFFCIANVKTNGGNIIMTKAILLSNDDGIYSSGIRTLACAMHNRKWDVTVIAPRTQRSGESKAITFNQPVRIQEVSLSYLNEKIGWRTTGTPADAVIHGVYQRANAGKPPFDLIVTGINAGVFGGVAGYRRLVHSRWGCRTNTTVAANCLAYHPKYRTQKAARRALDLLLGQETKEKHTLGFEVARLIGVEPQRGFLTYHVRFDVGYILNLCWRIGASLEDERIADIIDFILEQQGQYGLWEYNPYPQASRWVTFDLLRSLSNLDDSTDWLSLEPRIPFRAYPKRERRF